MARFRIEQLEERIAPSLCACSCECDDPKDDDCNDKPEKGNNGVGNGEDPQPPGNPPINDGAGTGPGNPGNRNR